MCMCVYVARTHGYMAVGVNTITLNPIQRPSLTTISGDRVAMIFTARYARLPTQALF